MSIFERLLGRGADRVPARPQARSIFTHQCSPAAHNLSATDLAGVFASTYLETVHDVNVLLSRNNTPEESCLCGTEHECNTPVEEGCVCQLDWVRKAEGKEINRECTVEDYLHLVKLHVNATLRGGVDTDVPTETPTETPTDAPPDAASRGAGASVLWASSAAVAAATLLK